jgi:CDP-glycerol glycerophosphotransferase (TagB/SpsB family)
LPKRKNLWLFGSNMGIYFSDNPKYLFLYIQKECKNIEAIWISRNKKVIHNLREQHLPAYYLYSLKGVFSCLRAKVIFTAHGKHDISSALTGGSIHVELYHFVMALKKLRYDVFNYYPLLQKIRFKLKHPFIYFKPDYSISSSPFASQIVKSSLCLSKEKVFLTGFPRTDAMLSETNEDSENVQKVVGDQKYTHLIYFTPTWRDKILDFDYFAFELDENNLVDFLEKTDSILILRFHPTDMMRRETIATSHPRIIFENHDLPDAFSLLKKSSVLITDYSGIFFDYLLIDRPIIFANFDQQGYLNKRELYWDYDEITPGPKAPNWSMLLSHLEKILVCQEDEYQEERRKLRDKVYQYKDRNSCARVVKEMYRILDL